MSMLTNVLRQGLLIALLAVPSAAWSGLAHDEVSSDRQAGGPDQLAEEGDGGSFAMLAMDSDNRESLPAGPSMPPAVPEPRAASMWLVGLAAFAFIARRRSSR